MAQEHLLSNPENVKNATGLHKKRIYLQTHVLHALSFSGSLPHVTLSWQNLFAMPGAFCKKLNLGELWRHNGWNLELKNTFKLG